MSRYAALMEEEDEEDEGDIDVSRNSSFGVTQVEDARIIDEDLSSMRRDEELALRTVYQQDFTKDIGTWGSTQFTLKIQPPDLAPEDVGVSLTLIALLSKQYPYVAPKLNFTNIVGLREIETKELIQKVKERARECALQGQEMMFELVIVIEEFLLKHNRTPKEQNMCTCRMCYILVRNNRSLIYVELFIYL